MSWKKLKEIQVKIKAIYLLELLKKVRIPDLQVAPIPMLLQEFLLPSIHQEYTLELQNTNLRIRVSKNVSKEVEDEKVWRNEP